ncbi:MAG: hypothetical protein HQL52_02605 [Magnetococcales bacterium]|nr:hypothetical protein [Magnetococcales bacterium]
MVEKKYVVVWSALIALLFAAVLTTNWLMDPYRLHQGEVHRFATAVEPNTRFLKLNYLKEHCGEFDAILFGTSRDALYDSRYFDRLFNTRAYNFSVNGESLTGMLKKLEWLLSRGCRPERILIPLSFDHITLTDYAHDHNDLIRLEPPEINPAIGWSDLFVKYYFNADVFLFNLNLIAADLTGTFPETRFDYDLTRGNVSYHWDHTFSIDPCPPATKKLKNSEIRRYHNKLREIIRTAHNHDITPTVVLSPAPIGLLMRHDPQAMREYLYQLAEFVPFIQRLPLEDERQAHSDHFHDFLHPKAPLLHDALIPSNGIPTLQLIDELQARREMCAASAASTASAETIESST